MSASTPPPPHAGFATQELTDAADRTTAAALLQCVCDHFAVHTSAESSWDGTHSCYDPQAEMPWYFLRVFVQNGVSCALLRDLVKRRPARVREIVVKLGVEPGARTGTAMAPEGVSSNSVYLQVGATLSLSPVC